MQMKYALLLAGILASFVVLQGCSRTDSTTATVANTGTGLTGSAAYSGDRNVTGPPPYNAQYPHDPAGAPNWALGKPMGNGFRELTADQAGGMGTGLMGFNDVGAAGTSNAITDVHHAERGDESSYGNSGVMNN